MGVLGVGRFTVGGSSVESDSHKFGGEGVGDWVDDLGGVIFSAVCATTGTGGDCKMHAA